MAPTKVSVLLLAAIIVLLATAVLGKNDGGCIRRVGEIETPVPGSCLCYDKCARNRKGGGDQAGLADAQAQSCFVDCVLRDGGWAFCPGGGGGGGGVGEAADAVAPLPPKLEVVVSKHVRVLVTRPRVSRSRKEKEETEEVLVVEMGFRPDVHEIPSLQVWLNTPEGKERELFEYAHVEPRYAGMLVVHKQDMVAGQDTAARRFPIGGNLEAIGADGDRTVTVSIAPYISSVNKGPYWYEQQTYFVRGAYIVYEPKEHHVTRRDGTGLNNDQLVTRWN